MADDTPMIFSVSPYARSVAREMYPGQRGQDDQQDAARHMLAAGTIARKYGPTIAELAGKAHEYSESPLRALMMLLGRGEMPPDYQQDLHNNALGIEIARRAQSQRELEDLIQAAAERSVRQQTTGLPWINKAQGGAVRGNQAGGDVRNGVRSLAKMFEEYATPAASTAKQAEVPGYAAGGLVANSPTDDFDPARIDAIVGELHAMNAS